MDAQYYLRCSSFPFKLMFLLVIGWVAAQATAADPEPRKEPEAIYVAVEQARLYAGPSSDFYPTGSAKRGTALEVYLRADNGWLGVRPPQGSFSWVPASQAYLLPGGRVIEITDANAVSWIGTELGSAKQYRWQVQLKVGEQLTLLGEATIKSETDDRETLWYKVSPPAGEFRWIEQAAVSKTAPQVKPTATIETQVATKTEPSSSASQSKPTESSIVDGKKNAEQSPAKGAVQSASFESPVINEVSTSNRSPRKPASGKISKAPQADSYRKPAPREDQWDGWYAFEMGEKGVQTPFLDKLSGRDRGPQTKPSRNSTAQHDPLIHDPFSLEMAGDAQKTVPDEPLPGRSLPNDVNSVAKRQREWRDPRELREARLGGASESIARRNADSVPGVLTASGNNLQNVAGGQVNTAGYEHSERQYSEMQGEGATLADAREPDTRAAVNWYGLNDGALSDRPGNAAGALPTANTTMNVVTNTADVGELQLALNNAVSASNGPWNLTPLAERARYLIEHGPTAIDRGQARLLLERIEAFQNVSARSQQVAGAPLQNSPVQSTSYNAGTQNLSLPNSPQTAPANYDATGWLVPVHAAGPDQPTHALTNDTGDVIAYVSPIAGLNLDRYRNQAVGINGLRGYLPQLQAAHIQAQRVSRVR